MELARRGVRANRPTRPAGPVLNSAELDEANSTQDDDLGFALGHAPHGSLDHGSGTRNQAGPAIEAGCQVLAKRKPLLLFRLSGDCCCG